MSILLGSSSWITSILGGVGKGGGIYIYMCVYSPVLNNNFCKISYLSCFVSGLFSYESTWTAPLVIPRVSAFLVASVASTAFLAVSFATEAAPTIILAST